MPVKHNKNLEVLNRRQQVANLYLQNWAQALTAAVRGGRKLDRSCWP